MTKAYLDIDGVLLTKKQQPPDHVSEFIAYVINNYDCYWLTTHCRNGENKAMEYLRGFLSKMDLKSLENVKPTNWDTLKTEAIDFTSNFVWLEDYPFEAEKKILFQNNKEESLILVKLDRKEELKSVIRILKQANTASGNHKYK